MSLSSNPMAEFRAQAAPSASTALRALILTDGKMGDLAQCRGVATALGAEVTEHVVEPTRLASLLGSKGADPAFERAMAAMQPPQLVLASGRRTAPYLKALKSRWGATILTVFLKDPRSGPNMADLIWVPAHDRLRGHNVIVTDTAPHTHNASARAAAGEALRERLKTYPLPWLGVLLGGRTRRVRYDQQTVEALRQAIAQASANAGSVIVTPSRRTPGELIEQLVSRHPHTWVWDGFGDNPYAGMLGACDAFLVTGDSHNMVSEALSSGRQVMAFRPSGLPAKFARFLDRMEQQGLVMPPGPARFAHTQPPLDATPVIAQAIAQQLGT